MINLLLEAYIEGYKHETKVNRNINWLYFVIAIITMVSSLFFLFLIARHAVLSYIMTLLSVITLFIDIVLWERKDLKQYKIRCDEYNKRLDCVRNILKNFNYDRGKNWYSSSKIQYLIQSGESFVEEHKKTNVRLFEFGKTIFFPIIAFVAGAIVNNAKINEVILTAIIVLFGLLIIIFLIKSFSLIMDIFFKSSSINEMNNLILLLKDLNSRDFD